MNEKKNNYLELIRGLKANNMEAIKPSLSVAADRIVSLLSGLDKEKYGPSTVRSLEAIQKSNTDDLSPEDRADAYIEFGEAFKYMIDDLSSKEFDYGTLRKITMAYFDIADKVNDPRVKPVAYSIGKALEGHKPDTENKE